MAMKIDRRAFLKTSAAMAVAVSMTGLLGGCSDGAIGTDFGLFQATAVKALGKTNGVDFGGTAEAGWEGYINVWVRIKDTSGDKKPRPIPAKGYFSLKINGQSVNNYTDGDLLENGGKINLSKGQFKEGWMHFTLKEDQKDLYEAVVAKKADVTFTISSGFVTEIYTLDYTTSTAVWRRSVMSPLSAQCRFRAAAWATA